MIQTEPEDIEQIRDRIRKMSDAELRKYGRAARDLSVLRKTSARPLSVGWNDDRVSPLQGHGLVNALREALWLKYE
jgi:hypothetical protein